MERLTKELLDKVFRYSLPAVRRIVGAQDAEDVLQSAALKAWLHAESFKGESEYTTWFTRIAINEALMHRRKRTFEQIEDFDAVIGRAKRPDELLAQLESNERLYAAILELRPLLKETAIRMLREEPMLTNRDKANRFRVREKLRELLGGR